MALSVLGKYLEKITVTKLTLLPGTYETSLDTSSTLKSL